MTDINIPFNAWSKKRLQEGRKSCTSRSKAYGKQGDCFMVEDRKYMLTAVLLMPTENIIGYYWKEEGAEGCVELRKVLKKIFRGHELPEYMFLHHFKEVKA